MPQRQSPRLPGLSRLGARSGLGGAPRVPLPEEGTTGPQNGSAKASGLVVGVNEPLKRREALRGFLGLPMDTLGGNHFVVGGDALEILAEIPPRSIDLIFFSPPYEDARSYGGVPARKGQAWVDWMVKVFTLAARACRGLVAAVVEGRTRKFSWSATPALLMADLHRSGFRLRKPPIYQRVGIPGSGGPDWLRNDYESIVCVAPEGSLRWSKNTAMGSPPKHKEGGAFSHRNAAGDRVNSPIVKMQSRRRPDGKRAKDGAYHAPKIANPGNIIKCHGGGGHMGHDMAHDNEAPFPLNLAEFFVRSFCPPGGVVMDPFSGSGTTGHAAIAHGRRYIGCDNRESQVRLTKARLLDVDDALRVS